MISRLVGQKIATAVFLFFSKTVKKNPWFQLFQSEHFLLFFVITDCKPNIFRLWSVGWTKQDIWALGTCDGQLSPSFNRLPLSLSAYQTDRIKD